MAVRKLCGGSDGLQDWVADVVALNQGVDIAIEGREGIVASTWDQNARLRSAGCSVAIARRDIDGCAELRLADIVRRIRRSCARVDRRNRVARVDIVARTWAGRRADVGQSVVEVAGGQALRNELPIRGVHGGWRRRRLEDSGECGGSLSDVGRRGRGLSGLQRG